MLRSARYAACYVDLWLYCSSGLTDLMLKSYPSEVYSHARSADNAVKLVSQLVDDIETLRTAHAAAS